MLKFFLIFTDLKEVSRRARWKEENVLFQMVSFLYPHPTLLFELQSSEVNRGSLK